MRDSETHIECKLVAHSPNCAHKPRMYSLSAASLLGKHFGYRTDPPGVRSLGDYAKKQFRFMVPIQCNCSIEMEGRHFPLLGNDAGHGKAGTVFPVYRGQ